MISRPRTAALFVATGILGAAMFAAAYYPSERATLCAPGYARSQRLDPARYYPLAQRVFAQAGIAWSERRRYELDHITPICLGGSWAADNLQAQPLPEAERKDKLEALACRKMCAGDLTPEEARGWFRDWKDSYRQQFGTAP